MTFCTTLAERKVSPTPNEDSHTRRETPVSPAAPITAAAARVNRSSARTEVLLPSAETTTS